MSYRGVLGVSLCRGSHIRARRVCESLLFSLIVQEEIHTTESTDLVDAMLRMGNWVSLIAGDEYLEYSHCHRLKDSNDNKVHRLDRSLR